MTRVSLRTLLGLTTAIASYFGIGQAIGYSTGAIFCGSLALLGWAVACRRTGWFLFLRAVGFAVGATLVWLAGFDGRWVLEACPDCGWGRDSLEYRLVGVPVWTDAEDDSDATYFALRDLGWVCEHPNRDLWVKHRYRGGAVCAFPCFNGTLASSTGRLYTEGVADRVQRDGKADPDLARRIHRKCLVEGDTTFFYSGLLIDWRTLAAFDLGRALEAREWIRTAPESMREQVESDYCDQWDDLHVGSVRETFAGYVDRLYETGVDEVVVFWRPADSPWSKPDEVWGDVVVRLPPEGLRRRQVFKKMSEHWAAYGYGPAFPDYGQQFADAYWLIPK